MERKRVEPAMRLPLAVFLLPLLAGCSEEAGTQAPAEDGPAAQPPLPQVTDSLCHAYHAEVAAPADAFQAAGPFRPAQGRTPGSIAALAFGAVCGAPGDRTFELWVGWRVQGGSEAVLDHVLLDNGTRAATLEAWGAPVEGVPMELFHFSQAGPFSSEGPGRDDGGETLKVTVLAQDGRAPEDRLRFWLVEGGQATGSIDWAVTGASAWWSGLGQT